MSKKLTDQEVEKLFAFTRKHYVRYYDLQVELVDHLAEGIEQHWIEKEDLSFEDALNAQFRKFGIHGFSHLVRDKKKALQRKYRRIQWQLIGEFYTLPKVFMTLAITLLIFTGFQLSLNNNYFVFVLLGVYAITFLVYYFWHYKKLLKLNLVPGKKFIIEEVQKTMIGGVGASAFLPLHLYNMFNGSYKETVLLVGNSMYLDLILSVLIAFYGITLVVMAIYIPKRIKADFESEFPQFVKAL